MTKLSSSVFAAVVAAALAVPAFAAPAAAPAAPKAAAKADATASGPAKAVKAFFAAMKAGDKDAVLAHCSPQMSMVFSLADAAQLKESVPADAKLKIVSVEEDGDAATVKAKMIVGDEENEDEMPLVRVDGEWKVAMPGEKPPKAGAKAPKAEKGLSPDKVAIAFLKKAAMADFAGAGAYASKQTALLLAMVASMAEQNPEGLEKHPDAVFTAVKTKVDGDKAVVTVKNSEEEETEDLTLVREDGEWKVDVQKDGGEEGGELDLEDFDDLDVDIDE